MAKSKIKKEYVIDIYKEVAEDILEVKKKVVTVYKNKLIEKGFKFYVEFITKNPVSLDLNHMFIAKHLETDRWVYINCHRNDSILYNGKEYQTFHTINIKKMGENINYYLNDVGYHIDSNNELNNITLEEIEKIYKQEGKDFYSWRYIRPERLKELYYIRDFSRNHKLDVFFANLA